MSNPATNAFQSVTDQLLQPFSWSINKKDILGFRFSKLLVLFPAGKGSTGVSEWLCRCDCGMLRTVCTASLRKGNTKSCGCLKYKDIVGKKFGKLTVIRRVSSTARGKSTWECLCDCGNTAIRPLKKLTDRRASSCGCVKRLPDTTKLDITGQVFGRLTALYVDEKKLSKTNGTYWICSCSCGKETSVGIGKLRFGHTKSCGCLRKDGPGRPRLLGSVVKGKWIPGVKSQINALFRSYKRHAEKREYEFKLLHAEFASLLVQDCVYCGSPPAQPLGKNLEGEFLYRNGVDRVDSMFGYTTNNCVPCCKHCNFAKSTMSRDDFLAHVLRIVEHSKLGVNP